MEDCFPILLILLRHLHIIVLLKGLEKQFLIFRCQYYFLRNYLGPFQFSLGEILNCTLVLLQIEVFAKMENQMDFSRL